MAVKTVICFYLVCLWLQAQAQQSILNLTSSAVGEICLGQTISLTCTHLDPDPTKYLPEQVAWAENGITLDFSLLTTLEKFTLTRPSSTASTLTFTVTEEDHANKVVTCSCFLLLTAASGGGREESIPPITMDVEAKPPTIMSTPDDTSGLLQWNSPSSNCSSYRYMFNLTWDRMEDNITGTDSIEKNSYDFTGMPGGNYTVSLKAKVVNFNLDESEPVTEEFSLTTQPSTTSGSLIEEDTVLIPIVLVVVIVIVAIITLIAIIVVIYYCRNKKKRVSQSCSPVTESEYSEAPNKKQEAEDELGQTRQELDKKQEAENVLSTPPNL